LVALDHDPLHALARAVARDGRIELEPIADRV
jgi:hypothetical protein